MRASIAIQVLPQTTSTEETVRIVDEVIAYIASSGLNYYVGPFETTIEGDDYLQLMEIATNCQLIALKAGCPKVNTYIKVVCRAEGDLLTIDEKIGKYHTED